MPIWLRKPSNIAIAVLTALLALQSWRLSGSQVDVAESETARQTLVADIATKRAEGVIEGRRLQLEAQAKLDAERAAIVAGLESDKAQAEKALAETERKLRGLAAIDAWACLAKPLPEDILKEFRR